MSLCLSFEDVPNKGRIEEDVRKLVKRLNPDTSMFDRLMYKGVLSVEDHKTLIEVDQDKENLLKILSRDINTRRTFNSFLAVLIESDQYFHVIDATGTRNFRNQLISENEVVYKVVGTQNINVWTLYLDYLSDNGRRISTFENGLNLTKLRHVQVDE